MLGEPSPSHDGKRIVRKMKAGISFERRRTLSLIVDVAEMIQLHLIFDFVIPTAYVKFSVISGSWMEVQELDRHSVAGYPSTRRLENVYNRSVELFCPVNPKLITEPHLRVMVN